MEAVKEKERGVGDGIGKGNDIDCPSVISTRSICNLDKL